MTKKPTVKATNQVSKHIVTYVYDCTPMTRTFDTEVKLNNFVKKFLKLYPPNEASESGYWIDLTITNIQGEIKAYG